MIEYSWHITKVLTVDNDPVTGIVVKVHWFKQGTDISTGISGRYLEVTELTPSENTDNFIPLENLTKEIVLAWIQETIDSIKAEAIDEHIAYRIKEQSFLPVEAQLPWLDPIEN